MPSPTTFAREPVRLRCDRIIGQLETERSSFLSHWRELGEFFLPRRPRFTVTDVNKGNRRSQNIVDAEGTLAARTLSSGMMSGITSPARPWFQLTVPDQSLAELPDVKGWLHDTTQRMATVFANSNLYNELPTVYGDIGVFGTGAMDVREDDEQVIRCYPYAIGSYVVGNDHRLQVRIFARRFRLTVRQVVEQFGVRTASGDITDWSNITTATRSAWENGNREGWVDLVHAIYPNDDFDPTKLHAKYKRFAEVYYEQSASPDVLLQQSGLDEFSVLVPRWEVTGEDVYGTMCPGMIALGDTRQLQLGERRAAQAIDKMVNPPLGAPGSLRTSKVSLLPGAINYIDATSGGGKVEPIHQVEPQMLQPLTLLQEKKRSLIQRAFFADLWLMVSEMDQSNVTAREIDERHEEKLLMLGPVLEQLDQDLLHPLIVRTFSIMLRRGLIAPAPAALQGVPLKVEYVSLMAQAQKLIGLSGLDRFLSIATPMAQIDPSSLDKWSRDAVLAEYGAISGLPPHVIVPDDQVQAIRAARAKQQAAQAQTDMAAKLAPAAAKLNTVPAAQGALSALLGGSIGGVPTGAAP